MGRCDNCGAEERGAALFTCNFCDRDHCSDHRLPEAHNCVALRSTAATEVPLREEVVLGDPEDVDREAGEAASRHRGEERSDDESGDESSDVEKQPCQRCGDYTTREQYCRDCAVELVNQTSGPTVAETAKRKRQAARDESDEGRSLADFVPSPPSVPRPGRRSFLLAAGGLLAGGAYTRRDQITETATGAFESQQLASVGIENIEWEGATLAVTFDPSFETYDGWVLHHEYEDPTSYRVAAGEYPRTDGALRMPFDDMLVATGRTYSSRSFEITAFEGVFSEWRDSEWGYDGAILFESEGSSVSLEAPEEAVPESVRE